MLERVLILPDVHLEQTGYDPVYETVKKFMPYFKPHETVLLGDFMDCASLSSYDSNKRKVFEGKRFALECDVANQELDYIKQYSRRITYLEGNHEYRIQRKIQENPQENEGMLELENRLSLMKRNIKWIKHNKLYPIGDLYFTHGKWTNEHCAKKHLLRLGCNIVFGHTHRASSYHINMRMQSPLMAWGLGCLCSHSPFWMEGGEGNWINQVGVMFWNTKTDHFNFYPINIIEDKFIYQGKEWK